MSATATTPSVLTVAEQLEQANASGRTPVVFVHGLWLLRTSWERWETVFDEAGYAPIAADWPDDPASVEAARSNPDAFAGKGVAQVADHVAALIARLDKKPAVVGHSFGGLMAQIVAGRGLTAAAVAIDPAPFRGVLPLPISALRSAFPVLGNPLNRGKAVSLTFDQFRYGWASALDEGEARELFDSFMVAAPGKPLFQAAMANLNPASEVKADTKSADRGPLLIISGEKDHTVPHAIAHASYKRQQRNPGVTEFTELPNRGHALVIDSGWREVADTALEFVQRFT
jgi:pimeloyl-ACP methyl ester carboxylesterase